MNLPRKAAWHSGEGLRLRIYWGSSLYLSTLNYYISESCREMVFHRGNASMTREEANSCESSAWQKLLQHVLLLSLFPSQWDKQETEEQGSPTWLHKIDSQPEGRLRLEAFWGHEHSRKIETRSFLKPWTFQRTAALQHTKSVTVASKSLFGYSSTPATGIFLI